MSLSFEGVSPNASLDPQVAELISSTLRRSQHLSKQLKGYLQDAEHQNRADLASALIISGYARANGIRANGTVGLDIGGDNPYRVHQPLGSLHPDARACLEPQLAGVPVKCSLSEHLGAKSGKCSWTVPTSWRGGKQ